MELNRSWQLSSVEWAITKKQLFQVVDASCSSYFWSTDVTKEDCLEKLSVMNRFSIQASERFIWSLVNLNLSTCPSGQDLVNTRNPSYRGRSSLFINELKRGNISLKLSRVKLSDEGTYECSIPLMEKKSFKREHAKSSDAATSPVISLSGIDKNRGGVVLQCESAGWYPEPELLWLDGEGNLLSAGPTETLRGPDDLYTVSSRVTVEKRHSNNITCRVQQKKISQNRETHIHVPGSTYIIYSNKVFVLCLREKVEKNLQDIKEEVCICYLVYICHVCECVPIK
uniref:Ig-like domain-containing protein n=1 Tax=Maylandia zebra TaxID=106582 RepID=A0A3P9B6T5_9CICH